MRKHEYKSGVTLVEMLIVLAAIMLLVSITIGVATSVQKQARAHLIKNTLSVLEAALEEYYDFIDRFPPQEEFDFANATAHSEMLYRNLDKIPTSRKILQRLDDSVIKDSAPPTNAMKIYDPWQRALDYRYEPDERKAGFTSYPVLTSAGPDRTFGTADDISNFGL